VLEIILAFKAFFANVGVWFPIVREYISLLHCQLIGGSHAWLTKKWAVRRTPYAPAVHRRKEFDEIARYSKFHITFNSNRSVFEKFYPARSKTYSCGLRINPEFIGCLERIVLTILFSRLSVGDHR